MLRSSHVLISPDVSSPHPVQRPKLRRSLSSTNLDFPRKNLHDFPILHQSGDDALNAPLAVPVAPFMLEGSGRPSSVRGHARGSSLDLSQPSSHSYTAGNPNPGTSKRGKFSVRDLSAAAFCTMLSETSSPQLDLEVVKKLRLLLRNETAR